MKKRLVLKLLTTLLILTSIAIPVFGDDGSFVSSPNRNEHEEVSISGGTIIPGGGTYIEVTRSDDCVDKVVLTPYEYRDSIENEDSYNQLVEAYEILEKTEDLSDLAPEIVSIAHDAGYNTEDLAVRYVFDITIYKDKESLHHDPKLHETYLELEVDADTLENYVCIMLYNNGKWTVVEGVRFDPNDPSKIYIPIITGSGTYAIIVGNEHTYGIGCFIHWIILGLGVLTSIIMLIIVDRKDDESTNSDEKEKDTKFLRTIKVLIIGIDYVLCIILMILFSNCKLDIIALMINYVGSLLFALLMKKEKDEQEN